MPIIGAIFGEIEDKLEEDLFFSVDVLKMTLCLTLLLLLLLLNTFETKSKNKVFLMTLDLLDGIEMLQVILERKEVNIPKRFEETIIAFACISFVLSHFQLEKNRFSDNSVYKYAAIIPITLQVLLGNCLFLDLRLALQERCVICAKNTILINHGILEIFQCCKPGLVRNCKNHERFN